MKFLGTISNDYVELEVIECDCGFHIGLDGTYLDQESHIRMECPCCGRLIDTEEIIGD
jgi:hypothetical protein